MDYETQRIAFDKVEILLKKLYQADIYPEFERNIYIRKNNYEEDIASIEDNNNQLSTLFKEIYKWNDDDIHTHIKYITLYTPNSLPYEYYYFDDEERSSFLSTISLAGEEYKIGFIPTLGETDPNSSEIS